METGMVSNAFAHTQHDMRACQEHTRAHDIRHTANQYNNLRSQHLLSTAMSSYPRTHDERNTCVRLIGTHAFAQNAAHTRTRTYTRMQKGARVRTKTKTKASTHIAIQAQTRIGTQAPTQVVTHISIYMGHTHTNA